MDALNYFIAYLSDLLMKAEIPNGIQGRIDQGGFAVYLEDYQGKIRVKFWGHNNDEDIKRMIKRIMTSYKMDEIIMDNGKLRRCEIIYRVDYGSLVNLFDMG